MKLYTTLICLLVLMNTAEAHNGHHCADKKRDAGSLAKTTIATPEEDDYDITYLQFNISLTNTATTISGDVMTTAKVAAATMPVYAFELDGQLTIDSFKFNGQLMTVNSTGAVRK